jgi:hypothetical protein
VPRIRNESIVNHLTNERKAIQNAKNEKDLKASKIALKSAMESKKQNLGIANQLRCSPD